MGASHCPARSSQFLLAIPRHTKYISCSLKGCMPREESWGRKRRQCHLDLHAKPGMFARVAHHAGALGKALSESNEGNEMNGKGEKKRRRKEEERRVYDRGRWNKKESPEGLRQRKALRTMRLNAR